MKVFSIIIVLIQAYLLGMSLLYVRPRAATYPDNGYHLWKQLFLSSLVTLGIALFMFSSISSLTPLGFFTLSLETLALGLIAMSVFYLRPRHIMDNKLKRFGMWKTLLILGLAILVFGLSLPAINAL